MTIDKYKLVSSDYINLLHRRFYAACNINVTDVPKNTQSQIDRMVAALYVAATSGDNPYRAINLDKNAYKGWHGVSYTHVKRAFSILEAEGFVDIFKGCAGRFATRICATDKLINIINERKESAGISYEEAVVVQALDEYQLDKIIVEGNEPVIGSRLDRECRVRQNNLKIINQTNLNQTIRIPKGSTADITKLVMYRVFNDKDLKAGGRFYGGCWINMPKNERLGIEINHKPVVELDYSGMHINLLYKIVGVDAPVGDAYDLGSPIYTRSIVKDALLKMINASNELSCLRALNTDYGLTWDQKKDLLFRIGNRHAAISAFFFSGFGVALQAMDAEIAESVMLRFIKLTAGRTAILPVHESFIVSQSWEEDLKSIMEECFMEAAIKVQRTTKKEMTPMEVEQSIKDRTCFVSTDGLFERLQESTHEKYTIAEAI